MYRWLRNFHLLAGLFCGAYLLMYAASAIQMGHNTWFNNKPTTTEQTISLAPRIEGARAVARTLMDQHGVVGELNLIENNGGKLNLRVARPGTVYEVEYLPDSGATKVKTNVANFVGMLNRIHHVAGLWHEHWLLNAFGIFAGVVSLLLMPISLTGIYLWFKLHQERVIGAILLGLSLAFTLPLIVLMRLAAVALIFVIGVPRTPAQDSLTDSGNLHGMLDAHLTLLAEQHWTARKAKVLALKTPDDVRRRQMYIRETIVESLGGWPQKTPLNPRITGGFDRDGYRVEKLIYESLPGFRVTANLYIPRTGSKPYPAVLGVAGHSNEGKAADLYQRGWIGMVKRGMLVLAYDPPGQGERSEYWDAAANKSSIGIGTREHTMAGLQCLLTGTNVARYEIWDGIRAIDYLLTREDVDPKRIAVAGNSGGGTQSAYLAAVEPRLAAAAPSCYITSWEKLWFGPGPQDAEQNFHAFLAKELDFPDFLISFLPRPIKVMTAIKDFFPIDGARATFREAAGVFELAGARDKIDFFEYDDNHGWSKPRREATYRWFEKHLNNRDDEGQEPEFSVERAPSLNVTETGQLATSGGTETVASLNRKLAEELYRHRRAAQPGADLRRLVEARLVLSKPRTPVTARKMGELGREGYRVERITLDTEPGIIIPTLLFLPAYRNPRLEAVLWLNPAGKAADAAAGGEIEKLVLSGKAVFAIDARGWGETASPNARKYQTFMRAFLLDRTIMGMQTLDALRAIEYLRTRSEIDPNRISVAGKSTGGAVALYAAILDPAIARVRAQRLTSYLEITRMPVHDALDVIVPGVLKDFDLPDIQKALGARYEP